jgi:hypothetical protein
VEGLWLRRVGIEFLRPGGFQIDRVGEDEARFLVERSIRDEVANSLSGLLFYPGVDVLCGGSGILHKIQGLKRSPERFPEEGEIGRSEIVSLLSEKPICHRERNWLAGSAGLPRLRCELARAACQFGELFR